MSDRNVSVEQIRRLPISSWELPKDELYIQLGCSACPNTVCLKAKGVTSKNPSASANPSEAQGVIAATDGVDKKSDVLGGFSKTKNEACPTPCPEESAIQFAVGVLNEQFGANLELPSNATS